MADTKNHIVLKDCRTLLNKLRLGNKKPASKSSEIPNELFYFAFFLPFTILLVLVLWFCFDLGFNLDQIIWPINVIISICQTKSIFYSLAARKRALTEAINKLQSLIDQSM